MNPPLRRSPRADGAVTRQRIIDVAVRLFAERGYAATASKDICTEAGTDLAAINYHFGNRDGLYEAVLEACHARFINLAALQELAASDVPPRAKLEGLIDHFVAGLGADSSGHMRICAREMLAPTRHFATLVNREVMPKFKLVSGIISEITGIAPGDPALLRCTVSLMAPCLMLFVVDRDTPSPPQQMRAHRPAELADHLKRFSLAGLDAIARER